MYRGMCAPQHTYEGQRQIVGVNSLLRCGSIEGSNLGQQTWQQFLHLLCHLASYHSTFFPKLLMDHLSEDLASYPMLLS